MEYARAASVGRPVAVDAPAGRADSAPSGGTALGSGSGSLVFGGSGVRGSQRAAAAVAAATDGAGVKVRGVAVLGLLGGLAAEFRG